ncbi:MAG: VapC toxin family PIN domain ribonuclease [Verrucomicrobia bacterium]|nr:MAG: VapC toxin family PIN domain ribonuclease [Verrucomicrobiota bacterium]
MKTKLLADSSVWIDHLHKTDEEFGHALGARQIHVHQAVIGELACGTLARRADVLTRLMLLPELPDATFGELLALIDRRKLWGRGLSWVDVHLLGAVLLAGARLWTHDRLLHRVAQELDVAYERPE